jgi:hypothetical protein
LVRTNGERIIVIAEIIERYATEHPQAADTAEGIRAWWVAPRLRDASPAQVQGALEYLVKSGRMARIAIAGGSPVYAGPTHSNKKPNRKHRATAGTGSASRQPREPSRKSKVK